MPALGSKTVLTPLKWDVCITPESRHRSATLPIAKMAVDLHRQVISAIMMKANLGHPREGERPNG
jgi:hypothetical protein